MTTLLSSNPHLPPYARFALSALSFSQETEAPPPDVDWRKVLQFCDRTQLTLPFALRTRAHLPPTVLERVDKNLADNAERWTRIKGVFHQLAGAFDSAGLDFLVLKGFTHCPLLVEDPRLRAQYDLDLLFPRATLPKAYERLTQLGYEPIEGFEKVPLDHLPAMVKKTGWTWKGNYFDVDLPLSIELHFQLWDPKTEGFDVDGLELFWERRQRRLFEGIYFSAFDPSHTIGYATLHLMRHLLRGDVRLSHVYEIACMLHRTSNDAGFWETWRNRHSESLRRVSSIGFALAGRWFGCALPDAVRESVEELPSEIHRWLRTYGDSPVTGLFRPNKNELWLHWNLVGSPRRRLAVVARRLIPERLAGPVNPVHLTKEQLTWRVRWIARCRYLVFLSQRVLHHARTLLGTVVSAASWFTGRAAYPPAIAPTMRKGSAAVATASGNGVSGES